MSIGTMQETAPLLNDSTPGGGGEMRSQSATTKPPEVEIHLFLTGKGLVDVFKWNLGGTEQDQLEVRPILDKYGLKTIFFAFTVDNGRGVCVPIRFNSRDGRSLLTYRDGTVVHIIAEPKNRVIENILRIVLGAVFTTLLDKFLVRHPPAWIKNNFSIPPWAVACIVIVCALARKSSRYLFREIWLLISRRS